MEILGIDIGGTGIKGAIVDVETGELVTERIRILTPNPATPEAVLSTVKEVVDRFDWKGAIGCGFPARVIDGVCQTASNIDNEWIGKDIGKLIFEKTGCRSFVLNDADAAGIAEMRFGNGEDLQGTVIILTIGTGIGSSLFSNGELFPNTEFGFIKVGSKFGEHYASNKIRENEELSWKRWAKRLNKYFHRVEFLFSPNLIIMGGGVCKKFDKYSHYFDTKAKVIPAKLQNRAGVIGAAIFASEKVK